MATKKKGFLQTDMAEFLRQGNTMSVASNSPFSTPSQITAPTQVEDPGHAPSLNLLIDDQGREEPGQEWKKQKYEQEMAEYNKKKAAFAGTLSDKTPEQLETLVSAFKTRSETIRNQKRQPGRKQVLFAGK